MSSKSLNKKLLSETIKTEALALGFFSCGIAKAEMVDANTTNQLTHWLQYGKQADMTYMDNNLEKRLDPNLLMNGVRSIVSVALNYMPQKTISSNEYQLAFYAYGKDYHDVIKSKLHALALKCGLTNYRAFCDTAPVLERYWAVQAGLGWIGRNHQLIIPKAGSMFFLGELFVDIELDYDQPTIAKCGRCHQCIDACPTHALMEGEGLDSNRCISYQTIENKGIIPSEIAKAMGNMIFGCDCCQKVCPWNRFAQPNIFPELQPKAELLQMTRCKWHQLDEEAYRRIFKGSAVKRAKYSGIMRNIHVVENQQDSQEIEKP